MYFGENPDKVKNIVSATIGRFQDLYAPTLKVRAMRMARSFRRDFDGESDVAMLIPKAASTFAIVSATLAQGRKRRKRTILLPPTRRKPFTQSPQFCC